MNKKLHLLCGLCVILFFGGCRYTGATQTGSTVKSSIDDAALFEGKAKSNVVDDTNSLNSSAIGTGTAVMVTEDGIVKEYSIVVYGDIDGDGAIQKSDTQSVKEYLMGINSMNELQMKAGDIYLEGSITLNSLVGIIACVSGSAPIDQTP